MATRSQHSELDQEDDEDSGFDFESLRDVASFVLRAPRRHPLLSLSVFGLVLGLGIAVSNAMPRLYNSQTKLLAQSSVLLRALSGANPETSKADNPIANAADTITRYDNLMALIKQADLVERFTATRAPLLRVKDSIVSWLTGARRGSTDEDKARALVAVLQKRLLVSVEDTAWSTPATTMKLSVDWDDPQTAYDLVVLVQKNFLEARYDSDVAAITDSIAVLEEHAAKELTKVDAALSDYDSVMSARAEKAAPSVVAAPSGGLSPGRMAPHAGNAVDADVMLALEEKRRQVRALEEERQRQLEASRQQLMQAKLTLTPMHPTVIALQQGVDALSQPSPELVQLKEDERALMAQIAAASVPSVAAGTTAPHPSQGGPGAWAAPVASAAAVAPTTTTPPPVNSNEDGTVQLARAKLGDAISSYRAVIGRIDGANVELEITRAAYKHRFTVLSPAEVALSPTQQTPRLIAFGSVLAAAILSVLVAVAADVARGRILEAWQIRRVLKVDVLGEIEVPDARP